MTAIINPSDFVKEMEHHWTARLGNVASTALRKVWHDLAATFESHIYSDQHPDLKPRWKILQPPTGSGKSQGTVIYCSMLKDCSDSEQPGVLIVTRLISDCDLMAGQINEFAGKKLAVSFHSGNKGALPITDLSRYPILVITHKAYELALDSLGHDGHIHQTWSFFHNYLDNTRKLVVIDEALDIIEESQAGLEGIRLTLGAIPLEIRKDHPYAIKAMEELVAILEKMEDSSAGSQAKEAVLLTEMIREGSPPNITALRSALKDIRFDRQCGKNDDLDNARLKKRHDERLKSIDHIFRSWVYFAKDNTDYTLNTARLLVPEKIKGAVVLDATASANVIYKLFQQAEVVTPPTGVRSYQNVRLHVAKGHKVGKVWMRNNAKEAASKLISNLNDHLSEKKVFICTHKEIEPYLQTYSPNFELMTGHWGKVDGSNEWKDCDTAVIFGLPYRPDTWTANVFFALQGIKDTKWLRSDSRPFGDYEDIRSSLKVGQIITEVVQAINRIRCRRVLDDQGNCPEADVYLLLPSDSVADEILNGIIKEMPGIQLCDWDYDHAKRKVRKGNYEEALMTFLETMYPGRKSVSQIKEDLGISSRTWERLISKVSSNVNLSKRIQAAGVVYKIERTGKTQRAVFLKT